MNIVVASRLPLSENCVRSLPHGESSPSVSGRLVLSPYPGGLPMRRKASVMLFSLLLSGALPTALGAQDTHRLQGAWVAEGTL